MPSEQAPPPAASEDEAPPKWPIFAFIGVVFIGAPLMPTTKGGGVFGKIIDRVYRRVGAAGLLAIPFVSLTLEKSLYDTYCSYHGQDIYAEHDGTPKHGGFPSGGASLPSLSLVQTRTEEERVTFRIPLLDKAWCALRGYE